MRTRNYLLIVLFLSILSTSNALPTVKIGNVATQNVTCLDCVNQYQIADVYVFNSGDTMTGNLDMSDNLILNVGNAGTDFTTGGGLVLADDLQVNGGDIGISTDTDLLGLASGQLDIRGDTNITGDNIYSGNILYIQSGHSGNYFKTRFGNTTTYLEIAGGAVGDMSNTYLITNKQIHIQTNGNNDAVVFSTTQGSTFYGTMSLNNNLITNVGDAGTDFTAGGGLDIAGILKVGGGFGSSGSTFDAAGNAWFDGNVTIIGNLSSINITNANVTGHQLPDPTGTWLLGNYSREWLRVHSNIFEASTNFTSPFFMANSTLITLGSPTYNRADSSGFYTGADDDLRLYFNGVNSWLQHVSATGDLYIRNTGGNVINLLGGQFIVQDDDDADVALFNLDTSARTLTIGASADTIATTHYGTLNMNANVINNIGNAGTDFDANGGLTLAGDLFVTGANNGITTVAINGADRPASLSVINSSNNAEVAKFYAGSGTQNSDIVWIGSGANAAGYSLLNITRGSGYLTNTFLVRGDGNVGIGANAPAFALQVNSSASTYPIIATDGTRQVGFYVDTNGGWVGTRSNNNLNFFTNGGAQQMTLTTSGNLGIKTTSPTQKLEVNGSAMIGGYQQGTVLRIEAVDLDGSPATAVNISIHGYEGRGKGIFISDASDTNLWFIGDGYNYAGIGIGYSTTTAGQPEYAANAKFFVGTNGRIGLNTTTPDVLLDAVSGDAKFGEKPLGSQSNYIYFNRLASTDSLNFAFQEADATKYIIGLRGSSDDLSFSTAGTAATTQMVIEQATGMVGINITNPSELLEINYGATGGNLRFNRATNYQWFLGMTSGSDMYISKIDATDANKVMYWKNTGLVGINTTNPASLLHLNSSEDTNLIIEADGDNTGEDDNARLTLRQDGNLVNGIFGTMGSTTQYTGALGNAVFIKAEDAGAGSAIQFATGESTIGGSGGTARMTILYGGNVGIGKSDPANTLDVAGTINAHTNYTSPFFLANSTLVTIDTKTRLYTTSLSDVSLTWGATAGQVFRSENSEFALGLEDTSPYPLYIQGRTNAGTARNIVINPLGGSVGIGTLSPAVLLDVSGNGIIGDSAASSYLLVGDNFATATANTLNPGVYVYKSGTTAYGMKLQYTGGEYGPMIFGPAQASRFISFGKVGAALEDDDMVEYMRIDLDNGNVGIGTATPDKTLTVKGSNALSVLDANNNSLMQVFLSGDQHLINLSNNGQRNVGLLLEAQNPSSGGTEYAYMTFSTPTYYNGNGAIEGGEIGLEDSTGAWYFSRTQGSGPSTLKGFRIENSGYVNFSHGISVGTPTRAKKFTGVQVCSATNDTCYGNFTGSSGQNALCWNNQADALGVICRTTSCWSSDGATCNANCLNAGTTGSITSYGTSTVCVSTGGCPSSTVYTTYSGACNTAGSGACYVSTTTTQCTTVTYWDSDTCGGSFGACGGSNLYKSPASCATYNTSTTATCDWINVWELR